MYENRDNIRIKQRKIKQRNKSTKIVMKKRKNKDTIHCILHHLLENNENILIRQSEKISLENASTRLTYLRWNINKNLNIFRCFIHLDDLNIKNSLNVCQKPSISEKWISKLNQVILSFPVRERQEKLSDKIELKIS